MSSCILFSVWVKKVENTNFFVFYPICLKFCTGSNFEMLIIKRRPKLKLENDLSKKNCNFLPILAQIITSTLQQREEPACGQIPAPLSLTCLGLRENLIR